MIEEGKSHTDTQHQIIKPASQLAATRPAAIMHTTSISLFQFVSVVGTTLNLVVLLANSAPTPTTSPASATTTTATTSTKQPVTAGETSQQGALAKSKRELPLKTIEQLELETQETGYLPAAYKTDSDYGYDSGKNSYGKQASDWSLYDQGMCVWVLVLYKLFHSLLCHSCR